jgi:protein associated with RNAse G/E
MAEVIAFPAPGTIAPMDESLIGRETPIHMTKYDGSYHRRWPARFVLQQGPLYLVAYRAGDFISKTPHVADDPKPWATQWSGDVYLYDDRWYNISRVGREGRTWFYVNIATPVEFDGAQFHCVDLDLDVSWYTDSEPRVLDEDEFVAHSEAMRYPADVIERARAAVDEVLGLIGPRAFPFDRT